jgi:hypothetical protein
MKLGIYASFAILVAMISAPAQASSVGNAHVVNISENNGGIVDIYLDVSRSGLPACAGTYTTLFRFDATTPAGQAMLSAFYLAFAGGNSVDVTGTATCIGNVESVSYFSIKKS